MRTRFLLIATTMLIMLSLVGVVGTASAELLAGIQLGYGTATYSAVYGEPLDGHTEWSAGVWAHFDYDDLLFTGFYQSSLGLDISLNRHLAQIGANYRFFAEGPLKVFGGLGYQFTSTNFKTPQVDEGTHSTLRGHGFAGQLLVDITITEDIYAAVTITGNPFMKWSHIEGTATNAIGNGSLFTAKFDIVYDFSDEFGVHLGAIGGTYGAPKPDNERGRTSSSYASVNLGITGRF